MSKKIEVDGHWFEASEPKTCEGRCVIEVRGLGLAGEVRDESNEVRTWLTGHIDGVEVTFAFITRDAVRQLCKEMIRRANPLPLDAGCKDMETWYEELPDD